MDAPSSADGNPSSILNMGILWIFRVIDNAEVLISVKESPLKCDKTSAVFYRDDGACSAPVDDAGEGV